MTIFSKIVRGDIPSYKCAENEEFYAFLDINPVTKGHTLVIPKREVDYFFDLSDEELARMMAFTKRVAAAIKAAFPCKKVGVAVMGLDVNHAHVHLAPLQSEIDMDFGKKKLKLPHEEMLQIASRIQQEFERA
ncbi:MAG: HIT family protein [Alloprevotella sp.]|nr:HIT family protein [Alloprevotella sp.]